MISSNFWCSLTLRWITPVSTSLVIWHWFLCVCPNHPFIRGIGPIIPVIVLAPILIQYNLLKPWLHLQLWYFQIRSHLQGLKLKLQKHLFGKHNSIYNILISQHLNYMISKREQISSTREMIVPKWIKQHVRLCTLILREDYFLFNCGSYSCIFLGGNITFSCLCLEVIYIYG